MGRIIQTLISSKRGKSAAELASELDCHPRTVYRDLEALEIAGFPIYTERVEGKNLWSLLDTVKHQIPIPFSLPELMALYFGIDMLSLEKKRPALWEAAWRSCPYGPPCIGFMKSET
ncbi:MAG: HTH domain-containing protein [Deltaproteobacteria bacterium]|nr:HTH domain-containing protein [Deltaproteobacteria bacterium]